MTTLPKYVEERDEGKEICKPNYPVWAPMVSYGDHQPLKPIIRCNCGKWVELKLHHVHANGTITASFYHKRGTNLAIGESPDGCEWHVFLQLLDYNCGDFPPEAA